jgi:hypothetical protein
MLGASLPTGMNGGGEDDREFHSMNPPDRARPKIGELTTIPAGIVAWCSKVDW